MLLYILHFSFSESECPSAIIYKIFQSFQLVSALLPVYIKHFSLFKVSEYFAAIIFKTFLSLQNL